MKKNSLKGLAILLVFTFVISIGFPQMAEAKSKAKSKAKKKYYTELMLDYKRLKIRVPDKDFLTDGVNYSLHYKSDKDRWAVQTSLYTRVEDAENPDFQPAEKFSKSKIFKLGKNYQMDYRLKDLAYEITLTFTKKHKKFFESLTEKDFIVEKDKEKETYKEIINTLIISGATTAYISKEILPKEDFSEWKAEKSLMQSKKLIKIHDLKEAYLKSSKKTINRQKAGIMLSDIQNGEDLQTAVVRQKYVFLASEFEVTEAQMDEETALLTFEKGKEKVRIFFVYDGKKTNKDTGKLISGTDKTIIYSLK